MKEPAPSRRNQIVDSVRAGAVGGHKSLQKFCPHETGTRSNGANMILRYNSRGLSDATSMSPGKTRNETSSFKEGARDMAKKPE